MAPEGRAAMSTPGEESPQVEVYEHWHEADRRALALARRIVAKIDADPGLIRTAIDNLARWRAQRGGYQPLCLDQWEEWFARGEPWERLRARLLEESDEGKRLRTSHPFAGVLSQAERESVYDFDWAGMRRDYTARTGQPWPDDVAPAPERSR